MIFEFKKIISSYHVAIIIGIFLLINLISIIGICNSDLENYYDSFSYAQQDIDTICDEAESNIENDTDTYRMTMINKLYTNRKWDYRAYDSREKDYVEYNAHSIIAILITIILVVKLNTSERVTNMYQLIWTVPSRNKKVFINKQLTIFAVCFGIQFIFFIENLIAFCIFGGVYPSLKMYTVPGYFSTWINQSIIAYKIAELIILSLVNVIIAEIAYIISIYFKHEIKSVIISAVISYMLYLLGTRQPVLTRYLNPVSLVNPKWLTANCLYMVFNSKIVLMYIPAVIVLLIAMLLSIISGYIISIKRYNT